MAGELRMCRRAQQMSLPIHVSGRFLLPTICYISVQNSFSNSRCPLWNCSFSLIKQLTLAPLHCNIYTGIYKSIQIFIFNDNWPARLESFIYFSTLWNCWSSFNGHTISFLPFGVKWSLSYKCSHCGWCIIQIFLYKWSPWLTMLASQAIDVPWFSLSGSLLFPDFRPIYQSVYYV